MNPQEAEPVVAVRGEASVEVEPEIAVLHLEVSGRDRDKAAALAGLAERQRQVADALRPFAAVIERDERGRVALYATYANDRQDMPDVWIASARATLTIGDLGRVPDIAGAVGTVESLTMSGPDWAVRPTSPVHRDTRIAAIQDALRRAADYAGAVGSTVVRLLEIADVGLSGAGGAPRPMMAMLSRAVGEPIELDLAPVPQTVQACVEMRVAISAPSVSLDPPLDLPLDPSSQGLRTVPVR